MCVCVYVCYQHSGYKKLLYNKLNKPARFTLVSLDLQLWICLKLFLSRVTAFFAYFSMQVSHFSCSQLRKLCRKLHKPCSSTYTQRTPYTTNTACMRKHVLNRDNCPRLLVGTFSCSSFGGAARAWLYEQREPKSS